MTLKNRLRKIEYKTQAGPNVDADGDEKLKQLTALLRSLEGVEKIDPAKLFPGNNSREVLKLAILLQRLDARYKLEYSDENKITRLLVAALLARYVTPIS